MSKPRALLSVTDKTGIVEFGNGLLEQGFELLSTGGTAKALREAGLQVTDVAEVTGFPEMLDGRVKTLHPLIHGGLLADLRLPSHVEQLAGAGISPISIVGVNLYAFEQTVKGPHDLEHAIESIDIGGPSMIRAGAKNWANVAVVVDPADYGMVLEAIKDGTIADKRLGQVPAAVIQLKPGCTEPTIAQLEAHLRNELPATHIPVAWRFVTALPRNRSVKVDRPALRKLFESELHANLR